MVDLAGAAVVAILTRAPSSGGKSRLFAALGRDPDPTLLEALLLDTLEAAMTPEVIRVIAVEPPHACDEVRARAPGVEVLAQAEGSLGARMQAVMHTLLARGARAVALVGSDLPDLRPALVTGAIAAVDADPAALVLGPAPDGGYYLIAASFVPPVFDGIAWGTDRVLAETIAVADRRDLRVHLLEALGDVDTVTDLRRVRASRTRAWARQHLPPRND